MRFRSKAAAVALAAMFVLGAIVAGSASAIPPEFRPASSESRHFEGSGPGGEIHSQGGTYEFKGSHVIGEITPEGENWLGTKTLSNVTLSFTGARVLPGFCYTKDSGEAEVVLSGLKGRLGYINKKERTVGVMFEPVKEPDATCHEEGEGSKEYQYVGDIMAQITPTGSRTKEFTLTFRQEDFKQSPTWFEGEKETFPYAPETLPLTVGTDWQCNGETCSFDAEKNQGVETEISMKLAGEGVYIENQPTPTDVSFKPAKGSGAFPVAFASSGGKTTFYTPSGKVECQHETGTGKFTSAQEAGVTIKFTGCVLGSVACGKVGESKYGEIETTALKGVLAYAFDAKSEEREAGLVLSPASGETFTTFACGALVTLTVKGSVIGVVSPLNSLTNVFGVMFKESSGSVQEPSEYEVEGGTKVKAAQTCSVNGGAAKACVEASDPSLTLTGEEALIEA